MKPIKKAQKLYTDAYMRWCNKLSHEENFITAKDISKYICNEVLGDMGADRGYQFWSEVKDILNESSHKKLYKY